MKTEEYIDSVYKYLKEKYGEVKEEWTAILLVLEESLKRYQQVKESINEFGIYDASTGKKNPLLTTEKDLIATILKISQKLGVSPWDASKIKQDDEENEEDFIESLTQ